MSDLLGERLEQAAADGGSFLFLSPHLDDAVLSCGALISTLVQRAPVTVATLFTGAAPPPHSRAARAYLGQCGAADAAALYEQRRREDVEVLEGMGVGCVHLGVADALFRRRRVAAPLVTAGRVFPEMLHRYPTYRFDIARGRVARGDRALLDRLDADVRRLMRQLDTALLFCPVGVGRHVDHLLTRQLGERHPGRVVYWSDFPYDLSDAPDRQYLAAHRLTACTWTDGIEGKPDLVAGYRTQVGPLFDGGEVPVLPERYFLPSP